MKFLKKLSILLMTLFALFCILVLLCAFNPDITDAVAGFLYPEKKQAAILQEDDGQQKEQSALPEVGNPYTGVSGLESDNGQGAEGAYGGELQAPEVDTSSPGLAENISTEYIAPAQPQVSVPENVSGRSGYQQVQDEREQIEDEAARELQNQIGLGNTGDGLIFDSVYYPYYAMLDEKGKHLYRQIYANADGLYPVFAPVEEISASQLKTVFAAVYNDHPELFWMETAYSCKCKRNGQCVEIDLKFNRTAQDLENAKAIFNEKANAILSRASGMGNDYEKEKFVHDTLIDQVSYNTGAEMNQSAYSALVNGQTVCAGYARAFQYLLQQLGIPCYYCTGYSGENHAWNIVSLEDGFYNVDTTWDDTDGGNYDYFNKTDQDYADTHVRQELAVYLPPCDGQMYRNLEQTEEQEANSAVALRSLEDVGMSEENLLYHILDYYENCYDQIAATGKGSYEFYNVVEGEQLMQEIHTAYLSDGYKQGYMEEAMGAVNAVSCEMRLEIEELSNDRYLIKHIVKMR